MLTHRPEHAQCKIGSPSQEIDEIVFWYEQNGRRFRGAGIAGIPSFRCEGRFGKRLDGAKYMDHLLFPRRIDSMYVDRAFLHKIKTFAAIAFVKEIIPLVQVFRYYEGCDCRDVGPGQANEELATAQRVFDYDLPELVSFQRHAAKLAVEDWVVSQKNVRISARLKK